MKKVISIISIISILFCLAACKAESKEDFSKYNINNTEETNGITTITHVEYATFSTAEDLYNASDYVVVATPVETFEESNQVWLDKNNKATEDFSKVDTVYSYTKRKMKVQKVYKGDDLKVKELTVCQNILINDQDMKMMLDDDYPFVKGEKYLLFLSAANSEEEMYFPAIRQGVYSLDSDKNTSDLVKEVKDKFKEEFKNK